RHPRSPRPRRGPARPVHGPRRPRNAGRVGGDLRRVVRVQTPGRPVGPRPVMTKDTKTILAAQAVRAVGYGFASILLGVALAARGWSPAGVGLLLSAVVA